MSVLNINFCKNVTSVGIDSLSKLSFIELGLSSLPNLKNDDFSKLISQSTEKLQVLNLSFNTGQ